GDLAGEARRAALVLDEVEQYEKTWNEQLVANWSEWQDRITTAAVDVFSDDGGRSAALPAQYQEQTRRTEEAARRRAETLARWHERCGITAMAVHEATGALHRTVGVLGSGTRSAGAPTDPATARARLAVLAFRDLLGDHGPGLADQVAAVVAGLT